MWFGSIRGERLYDGLPEVWNVNGCKSLAETSNNPSGLETGSSSTSDCCLCHQQLCIVVQYIRTFEIDHVWKDQVLETTIQYPVLCFLLTSLRCPSRMWS